MQSNNSQEEYKAIENELNKYSDETIKRKFPENTQYQRLEKPEPLFHENDMPISEKTRKEMLQYGAQYKQAHPYAKNRQIKRAVYSKFKIKP